MFRFGDYVSGACEWCLSRSNVRRYNYGGDIGTVCDACYPSAYDDYLNG